MSLYIIIYNVAITQVRSKSKSSSIVLPLSLFDSARLTNTTAFTGNCSKSFTCNCKNIPSFGCAEGLHALTLRDAAAAAAAVVGEQRPLIVDHGP